jgi:hypothetical protein
VRPAHLEDRTRTVAFYETFAQVQEQGREVRRDLPMEEALYNLVGLSEAFGELSSKPNNRLVTSTDMS